MNDISSLLSSLETERSSLIKALQVVQADEGFISDEAIRSIGTHFSIPPVEVEGVVSFYAQFKRIKPGKYQISVCDGTACHIKGTPLVTGWISETLNIRSGETDEKGFFSLETVACLGCCSLAPVISVNGKIHAHLDRKSLIRVLKSYKKDAPR